MTETVLTPRQQRERDFFDEHSALYEELAEVNFDAIAGLEHRPWNPYWFVLETAKQLYSAGERTLLDAGCGEGIYATLFAAIGFKVAGFDISPKSVEISRRLATANGFSGSTRFSVQAAEHLNYPDDSFDVVVGVDILHHVEVVPSVAELLRVLRPGGTALFREFVEVPAFDGIRNTGLVRRFFPKEKHQDACLYTTEDERKLTDYDIESIRALCPALRETRFNIFARLDRFLRSPGQRNASYMEKFDHWLCGWIPSLSRFGGSVVLELKKASAIH